MLPREKFLKGGISVLSDLELVEILVGSGVKGKDFKQISRIILHEIQDGIKKGEKLEIGRLRKVLGVGDVVAMRILAGIELGRRVYGLFDSEVIKITDSQSAYKIFKDMKDLKRERVDMVCLNSRFEYICRECIALGSLNCANLSPREVLYTAIVNNSAFVILAHNHPSRDCTPSKEDMTLTQNITNALELVGIQLLDHIVVGGEGFRSIAL